MTLLCGIDNIMKNIPHIQIECEKYFAEYCHSRKTLSWLWIMLRGVVWTIKNNYFELSSQPQQIVAGYQY